MGNVNGVGLAFDLEGQVMTQMALTGLAVAAGAAAFSAKNHQAGGDKRAVESELLDTGVEVTPDQGGMFGNFHGAGSLADSGCGHDCGVSLRIRVGKQKVQCEGIIFWANARLEGLLPNGRILKGGRRRLRCEDLGIPQSCIGARPLAWTSVHDEEAPGISRSHGPVSRLQPQGCALLKWRSWQESPRAEARVSLPFEPLGERLY